MKINNFRELHVYQSSMDAALKIFKLSSEFPVYERYSLTDQIRRSSRSVCANLAEAWRRRRYKAAFIAKLNDCETEAAETEVWLEFAFRTKYISEDTYNELVAVYEQIISQLVLMSNQPEKWIITPNTKE